MFGKIRKDTPLGIQIILLFFFIFTVLFFLVTFLHFFGNLGSSSIGGGIRSLILAIISLVAYMELRKGSKLAKLFVYTFSLASLEETLDNPLNGIFLILSVIFVVYLLISKHSKNYFQQTKNYKYGTAKA